MITTCITKYENGYMLYNDFDIYPLLTHPTLISYHNGTHVGYQKLGETLCSKLVGGVVRTMKSTWRNFLVVFGGAHYGHDHPS
jgi:hypothetical protein